MVAPHVLVIGQVTWPGSIEASYYSAFRSIGVDVAAFDSVREGVLPQQRSWVLRDWAIDRVRARLIRFLNHAVLEAKLARRTCAAVWGRTDLVFVFKSPWLKRETLARIREGMSGLVFHLNPDSPFDSQNTAPNLIRCIPLYDCSFTWSRSLMVQIATIGAKRVEYLPFAWDPELHPVIASPKGEGEAGLASDLAFVGAWTPDRERWLEPLADLDLAIWGDMGWARMRAGSPLCRRWRQRRIVGQEFARVCRTAKINLNFLRPQNRTSHNMRTFEVPGAGGFLLTERSDEQIEFLREGEEIACFATPEELRTKISEYLPRDSVRAEMSSAAHKTVAGRHTYVHRAQDVLTLYEAMRR